jgi:hypothetical protein
MHYGFSSNVPPCNRRPAFTTLITYRLVETHGLAHSGLDVQGLDVLPVFLE